MPAHMHNEHLSSIERLSKQHLSSSYRGKAVATRGNENIDQPAAWKLSAVKRNGICMYALHLLSIAALPAARRRTRWPVAYWPWHYNRGENARLERQCGKASGEANRACGNRR